jgi:hypothetical protein
MSNEYLQVCMYAIFFHFALLHILPFQLCASIRPALAVAGLLQAGLPAHPAVPAAFHAHHRHDLRVHDHPHQVPEPT